MSLGGLMTFTFQIVFPTGALDEDVTTTDEIITSGHQSRLSALIAIELLY
jgi:hypothetical protein